MTNGSRASEKSSFNQRTSWWSYGWTSWLHCSDRYFNGSIRLGRVWRTKKHEDLRNYDLLKINYVRSWDYVETHLDIFLFLPLCPPPKGVRRKYPFRRRIGVRGLHSGSYSISVTLYVSYVCLPLPRKVELCSKLTRSQRYFGARKWEPKKIMNHYW